MGNYKSVFHANVISGYFEKFIKSNMPSIAYFSTEFGVTSNLLTYYSESGVFAGDYLKTAKDYNLPIVGIGIKWRRNSRSDYNYKFKTKKYDEKETLNDIGITFDVHIENRDIKCKVWKVNDFSDTEVYLIDTYLDCNCEKDRMMNVKTNNEEAEKKITREVFFTLAGLKLLKILNKKIDIYHFNGSYSLFASLILIEEEIKKGMAIDKAINNIKNKIVLTMYNLNNDKKGKNVLNSIRKLIDIDIRVEKELPQVFNDRFDIDIAAINLCRKCNGASIMQTKAFLRKFKNINYKRKVIDITNGVHLETWVEKSIVKCYKEGRKISAAHFRFKERLLNYINRKKGIKFDNSKMLIAIGGNAASYNRNNLIIGDMSRVKELLEKDRIKIIAALSYDFSDYKSREIINSLKKIEEMYPNNIAVLEYYNMEIEKLLTTGADLWINCTRCSEQRCNIAVVKAAMNGVLNLSTLSGCWPEACVEGINGWQIGSGYFNTNLKEQDEYDRNSLYDVLTDKVIPTYYGSKNKWEDMMVQSIKSTIEYFNIEKTIIEYHDKLYI